MLWIARRWLPGLVVMGSLAAVIIAVISEISARKHQFTTSDVAVAAIVFYTPDIKSQQAYLDRALDLYKSGKIDKIVCVGGARPERNYYGSVEMGYALSAAGVPFSKLLCNDRTSDDSVSNLQVANHMLGREKLKYSVLVTDRLHGLRLMWLAQRRLDVQVGWLSAPNYTDWHTVVFRAFWELASWSIYLLPEYMRKAAIDLSRN